MSEAAVAQLRSRMLKETEGFLSQKLSHTPHRSIESQAIQEYFRRFALRYGGSLQAKTMNRISI